MQISHTFDAEAIQALQDASESYMQELFAAAYDISTNRNRVTLFVDDIREVRKIRGAVDPLYK